MPQKPVEGTGQVNAELPVELLDELKRFAKSRGEKVREVIEQALRRHMAYPPPPVVPPPVPPIAPLPPVPASTQPVARVNPADESNGVDNGNPQAKKATPKKGERKK
jgi:hypothetical protein